MVKYEYSDKAKVNFIILGKFMTKHTQPNSIPHLRGLYRKSSDLFSGKTKSGAVGVL